MPATAEDSERPVPDTTKLPAITAAGPYDGPTASADVREEAMLLASARCALHPLYRRSPGDCLTLLYRARALDVPVGIAMDHIYVNTDTGRAGLSAQLMAYLLRRAGITWKTVRETEQVVEFLFMRGRKRVGAAKWEYSEAVAYGLTRRLHWQVVPIDCLWARALARGCRRYFSDIVMGLGYTPEEVYDMTGADTAPDAAAVDVPDDVQEYVDQAASESATSDLIRGEIMSRARKAKKLKTVLPDGRTLEQVLAEMWRTKAAQEAAARADAALAELDANARAAAETPPAADAPAGTGLLPCGCDAAAVAHSGDHGGDCRDRAGSMALAGSAP